MPEHVHGAETELLLGRVHRRHEALETKQVADNVLASLSFDEVPRDEEQVALLDKVSDAVFAKVRTQLLQDPRMLRAVATNVVSLNVSCH